MQFTGRNLELVHAGLLHAISDCRMQIGSCPDVFEYAEDIAILEAQAAEFARLAHNIELRRPDLKESDE